MKHNKKKQDFLLLFIGIICLIVFVICAVSLLRYYRDYRQEKSMDEELRELGRQVQTEAAENNQGNAKDEDQDEQEFPQINALSTGRKTKIMWLICISRIQRSNILLCSGITAII